MTKAPLPWRLFAALPLPVLHAMGTALGLLAALAPNRHRRITTANIALCFPELSPRERHRLVRHSLVETGKTLAETPLLWLGAEDRVRRLVHGVSGEGLLDQAVAAGKGVIIVSPHLGSWEMVGLHCSASHPMTCLYRPPKYRTLEGIVIKGRGRFGGRLAPTDAKGVRILYQALARGETVGILPDQDPRTGGAFGPFFGHPAYTMTLLSRLAAKSGAGIVFCFAERLPRSRGFHLHFLPAPPGVDDPDPQAAVAALNDGVERCVRLAPSQYQWSYKRFRTRPEGEAPLY